MNSRIVRGESGDRLIAGPSVVWSLSDSTVAHFGEDVATISQQTVVVTAGSLGETTVTVTVGNLATTLPLEEGMREGMGGAGAE